MQIIQNRINYEVTGLPPVRLPADLDDQAVQTKVKASRLNGYQLKGLSDTTPQETRAMLWLLAEYCADDRRDMTFHAILPLPGGAVGQIILRYGPKLQGTATLAGRGLPMGGDDPGGKPADLLERIRTQYRLAGIGGTWTPDQVLKLYHALARVPGADRPALLGVVIERVPNLGADKHGAHTQGRFSHTAGRTSGDWGTLTLTDAAFTGDEKGFYGGADGSAVYPPSAQVILHEVGHAVESQVRRAESRANAELALAISGRPAYPRDRSLPDDAPIKQGLQLRYQDLRDADAVEALVRETYNLVAVRQDATGKIAACRNLGGKVAAFAQAVQAMKGPDTVAPAERLLKEIQREHAELVSWYEYARDMIVRGGQGEEFDPPAYAKIKDALAGKLDHTPWLTYTDELNRWAELQIATSTWRKKYTSGQGLVTRREQNLVDHATRTQIGVALTPYTKAFFEEDKSATELYAEAYGLWLVHPEAVASHSAELLAYFTSGAYRQGD
ncbi:hypothetical protein FXF51_39600 [Nonomuraea sp. PA05]|uniref:hypothetical protein n=1 Tax=Nonomuraea sp. PA05 TaxID=2604466 RepID=UPI0011D9E3BC|nr:hypothetical protein [Nonomuraea sp. PA05]TYB57605.1 hypothetical protein FXF51_39600 [Nonomuraea sp. PA05]